MIETERLTLHPWAERHLDAFAALHADPDVMADLGGPIGREDSDGKFDRYRLALIEHGVSRWAVEAPDGSFLGYCGVMPRLDPDHPLGPHFEIGWRFRRGAWGQGYATESARAALAHARGERAIRDIVSFTSAENQRSQSVMRKLGFVRVPTRDFTVVGADGAPWRGLVWLAS